MCFFSFVLRLFLMIRACLQPLVHSFGDETHVCVLFQLMAVYEEQEAQQRGLANTSLTPSPDLYQSELSAFQPITGGEIEVNSSALKSSE